MRRTLRSVTVVCGALLLVLLMFTGTTTANPLSQSSIDGAQAQVNMDPALPYQPRVGMVQTLTCTSPNCLAQCRGRGYRRGSCQIGRCFCSYV